MVESCCGSDAGRRCEGGSVDAVDDPGEIVVEAEDAVGVAVFDDRNRRGISEAQLPVVVPLETRNRGVEWGLRNVKQFYEARVPLGSEPVPDRDRLVRTADPLLCERDRLVVHVVARHNVPVRSVSKHGRQGGSCGIVP